MTMRQPALAKAMAVAAPMPRLAPVISTVPDAACAHAVSAAANAAAPDGPQNLRDAMAVDRLEPCGVYFGTTGGQIYGSADGGDRWQPIVRDLPAVLSVEVQTLP